MSNDAMTPAEWRARVAEREVTAQRLRAEADRLAEQAEAYERHLEEEQARAARAGAAAAGAGLYRSTMAAKAKSDFITRFGKAAYDALPFDAPKPEAAEEPRRPTWSPNWR